MRFAFRLALTLGIADPVAWIDSVPREVLTRWIAYDAVEPIPFPWLQTATVAAESYRVAQYVAASGGGELDSRSVASFMPGSEIDKTATVLMTSDQSMQWATKKATGC